METKEQQERVEVEKQLNNLGFETMYGGGKDDKGHGFWLKDHFNLANQEHMPGSTFHSIEECRTLITQT